MIIRTAKRPAALATRDQCRVVESRVSGIAILSVRGAVDMLSAPQLEAAICAARETAPVGLIVDLTEVDFLASVGMSVLIEAQEQAAATSLRFGVVADGAATSRPMRLLGIDAVLTLHPTLAEALCCH